MMKIIEQLSAVCLLLLLVGGSAQAQKIQTLFPCDPVLEDPYGIAAGLTRRAEDLEYRDLVLPAAKEAGFNALRMGIYWDTYIDAAGNQNQGFHDPIMQEIKEAGIKLTAHVTHDNRGAYTWTDQERWLSYVREVVSRYRYYCKDWQLLPGVEFISVKGVKITPEMYYASLKGFDKAVKTADRGSRVILGGIIDLKNPFLDSLLAMGAANHFDVMNYTSNDSPEFLVTQFQNIRNKFDKYSAPLKPIWITCRYHTNLTKAESEDESLLDKYKKELVAERETEQARRLPRDFIIAFALGAERVFWDGMRSPETSLSPLMNMGLCHSNLKPKPAYQAMQTLTSMLPNHSHRPEILVHQKMYLASWQTFDGRKIWAIWSPFRISNPRLKIEGNAQYVDYLGNRLKVSVLDEVYKDVIYIIGADNVSF